VAEIFFCDGYTSLFGIFNSEVLSAFCMRWFEVEIINHIQWNDNKSMMRYIGAAAADLCNLWITIRCRWLLKNNFFLYVQFSQEQLLCHVCHQKWSSQVIKVELVLFDWSKQTKNLLASTNENCPVSLRYVINLLPSNILKPFLQFCWPWCSQRSEKNIFAMHWWIGAIKLLTLNHFMTSPSQ
jgi:hypothetical protein